MNFLEVYPTSFFEVHPIQFFIQVCPKYFMGHTKNIHCFSEIQI